MYCKLQRAFCLLALAVAQAGTVSAAVVYVDADLTNTVGADSGLADWNDGSPSTTDGGTTNDGLWRFRNAFGYDGIWEATSTSDNAEDAVELKTTVSGVADGTYDVYVFYHIATGAHWNIRGGLSSNPNANPLFDTTGTYGTAGLDAGTLTFAGADPATGNQNTTQPLVYGLIGQVTVTGGAGSFDVFIDDYPANTFGSSQSNFRSWYDGVGYQLVGPAMVPEPTAIGLFALGGLLIAIAFRRLRRS